MTATKEATTQAPNAARRNEKVGQVVSTKMKKFYAHDEQSSARMGDVVRIRETRPLSKLKRWSLEEIVRRSSLAQIEDTAHEPAS